MRKLRVLGGGVVFAAFFMWSQEVPRPPEQRPRDTVQEAQRSVITGPKRPEQSKTPHDQLARRRGDATRVMRRACAAGACGWNVKIRADHKTA